MNVGELKKRLAEVDDDVELLVIDWSAGMSDVLNGHLFNNADGSGRTYAFYTKPTVLIPQPVKADEK